MTALHIASEMGRLSVAQTLLSFGADVNARDEVGALMAVFYRVDVRWTRHSLPWDPTATRQPSTVMYCYCCCCCWAWVLRYCWCCR